MLNYSALINLLGGFARRRLVRHNHAFGCCGYADHAILGVMAALLALALPMCAQEFVPEKVVFPITGLKPDIKHFAPLSLKFGTGFCLDAECRFVGTNYHVAKIMGEYVRIKGVLSAHRYLDSNADDVGAGYVNLSNMESLKYTPAHDLAIYEMRHPIKGFHGVSFESDGLENASEADVYAYPFDWNPKRGLVHWHCTFLGRTRDGLLAFSYGQGRVSGGASGGIVINSNTRKIVGILNGVAVGQDRVVLAVPVKELSDFIMRAQPYLQATLFPKTVFVSPISPDLYPPYTFRNDEGLSGHSGYPTEVFKLRLAASRLAESMRNFIATQTFAWGYDKREPEWTDAYETQIVDGVQRWRRPGKKKFYNQVPIPPLNDWLIPGADWSGLPRMVGTETELKIHEAPDAAVGGRPVHVFQYAAEAEDRVCSFEYYKLIYRTTKSYDCHGEIWVDDTGMILRISQGLDLTGPAHHYWAVVTYGWLEKDGMQYLVPVSITAQVEKKKTYWCRGLFTDYQMFDVKSRLMPPNEVKQPQKLALGPLSLSPAPAVNPPLLSRE